MFFKAGHVLKDKHTDSSLQPCKEAPYCWIWCEFKHGVRHNTDTHGAPFASAFMSTTDRNTADAWRHKLVASFRPTSHPAYCYWLEATSQPPRGRPPARNVSHHGKTLIKNKTPGTHRASCRYCTTLLKWHMTVTWTLMLSKTILYTPLIVSESILTYMLMWAGWCVMDIIC